MQILRGFSAAELVTAWEYGRDKHPLDRAMLLLALACPTVPPETLSKLTVGQRNVLLLALRSKTLGVHAECTAHCPQCNEQLEFTMDTTTFYVAEQEVEPITSTYSLSVDAIDISFRLPTSADLAALVSTRDAVRSRQLLIGRCVLQAQRGGTPVAVATLPEVVAALARAMLEHDPLAEIEIEPSCSECGHSWITIFDIASFFWSEIVGQAGRLLREVDMLARVYGWHEADILAMSAARRQLYLELVQ